MDHSGIGVEYSGIRAFCSIREGVLFGRVNFNPIPISSNQYRPLLVSPIDIHSGSPKFLYCLRRRVAKIIPFAGRDHRDLWVYGLQEFRAG